MRLLRCSLTLVLTSALLSLPLTAQERPEPFLLLEVNRDCATLVEDQQLLDAIELRVPTAFVVRGAVDGVAPDWHVTWRPTETDVCELTFESVDNNSTMTLGPHPGIDEIQLAASRVAWLSSVSPPRDATTATEGVDLWPGPAEIEPTPEPDLQPEPDVQPAPEPEPEPEPELEPEPEPETDPEPPAFNRVATKVSVVPDLVLVPEPLPERAVPRLSLNLIGGRDYGLDGVQIGLVWNDVETFARGAQIAMGANMVSDDADLVQIAGGANLARGSFRGVQVAPFNYIKGMGRGVQVGVANVGHEVRGVQVGVVNIARTSDVSVGLVNVMYGEPLYVEASIGHTGGVQAALKHGSKYLRWTYLVGYEPLLLARSWRAGLGLGAHLPFNKLFIDLDVLGAAVVPVGEPAFKVSQLVQLRFSVGWQFARRFAIFGGADGKALASALANGAALAPEFASSLDASSQTQIYLWPEFHVGVRF